MFLKNTCMLLLLTVFLGIYPGSIDMCVRSGGSGIGGGNSGLGNGGTNTGSGSGSTGSESGGTNSGNGSGGTDSGSGDGSSGESDQRCSDIGGVCQDDSGKCGGSYYSGKCSGGANNRCCTTTAIEKDTNDCSGVTIISRDSWGARRTKSSSSIKVPVLNIYIHHTVTGYCSSFSVCISRMKQIQNGHMDDTGYDDIGYSFLVGDDGKIYEGRGWGRVGSHTKGYNSKGFGISFIGNFMTLEPNTVALNAAKALIQCGINNGKISTSYYLYGHRDTKATKCPGDKLYDMIKLWPHYYHRIP
ncbi:peptidoglycan-recognition protein SC2-like [Mytilus galloprovincialis]|uniref:peptidoglycan-recognition protein SC2-like n=1 Tax=Mytilus galloprovincialis TaxID=29158 RepID=UPI003F7C8E4B